MPTEQVDYRLILKVCQAVLTALSTSFSKFSKPMPADGMNFKFGTFSIVIASRWTKSNAQRAQRMSEYGTTLG